MGDVRRDIAQGRPRRSIKLWVMFAVALALCVPAVLGRANLWAQDATKEATKEAPKETSREQPPTDGAHELRKVVVGIYVNQVKSFSLANNEFLVDFWIWFRWKDDREKPQYDPLAVFEVINAKVEEKTLENRKWLDKTGEHYAAIKVLALIKQFFDVARFPLDNHAISIQVEDGASESHMVEFIPDSENCGISAETEVPGWRIVGGTASVRNHVYPTSYGDISLPPGGATYSRLNYNVELKRPGLAFFFKLFWSIFLATLIGFLALLVKPTDLDPRFGLGVGAIFAASASAYVVNAALPETNIMTLSDKINMLAIAFIFISMIESIIALRMVYAGKEPASAKLDKIAFVGLLVLYGLGNALLVLTA